MPGYGKGQSLLPTPGLEYRHVVGRCLMKPWFLVFLMVLSGGYLFADVASLAAQEAREAGHSQNTMTAELRLVPKNIGKEQQLEEKAVLPLQLAQEEQKQPERPILRLRPDIGTVLKSRVQPPPPPSKPWYTETTVIVALISALGAVIVAVLGLVRRGRSE
jgi:hypothetical protein